MMPLIKRIRFGFCNMNGLVNKANAVSHFFKSEKLDIFFMVETWLTTGDNVRLRHGTIFMNMCQTVEEKDQQIRVGRSGEGIMILARSEVRPLIKVIKRCETKRWVLLKVEEYFIVCAYFSPTVNVSEITDMLDYVCTHEDVDLERLLFVGDFNARMGVQLTGDSRTNGRYTFFRDNVLKGYHLRLVRPAVGKWTNVSASGKGITDLLLRYASDSSYVVSDLTVHETNSLDGSDHRPMSWSVPIHREYIMPTIERWNIGRLRIPLYAQKFSDVLHDTFTYTSQNMTSLSQRFDSPCDDETIQVTINAMYEVFTNWIDFACSVSIGKAYFDVGETCPEFNNDKVQQARRALQLKCGQVTLEKTGTIEYRTKFSEYKIALAEFRQVCKDRRYVLFEDKVETMALAGNVSMFQKTVSAIQKRASRSTSHLDPDCLSEYAEYFRTTFGAKAKGESVREKKFVANVGSCPIDLSEENIVKALGFFKCGKAAGPDNMSAEIIKHESELSCQLLSTLFMTCYKYAMVPEIWCKANVVLVFKNKGEITDVSNYRPISLTCVVRRLFERLMLQYMVPFTENILHPSQGGFRPGRSTIHQCYALHEIMKAHPKAIHAFLDLRAAYDCVNQRILWRDMETYGVSSHMIAVCQALFSSNKVNLVVGGQKGGDILCRRGLLQGSSLSPLLFNLYINSLVGRLDKLPKMHTHGLSSNSLFFADDGGLHAKTPLVMQCLLDECSKWGIEYGMEFAAQKCAIMTNIVTYGDVPFRIQGGNIPTVETFVYLGVECNAKGMCFAEKHKERCANVVNTAKFLKTKGMNVRGWRASTRVLAYKVFLRPRMEYGCPLMRDSDGMVSLMEKTQSTVLNMVFSCSRTTSRGALLKLSQIETMESRREKLEYSFFNTLDRREITDAPASIIWHSHDGVTKHQAMVQNNRIFKYSRQHTQEETTDYIRQAKFNSMQVYDKRKEGGMWDVAGSIRTPQRPGLTVYTDPSIARDDQELITYLRLGALTFHQPCSKCGEPITRIHAAECSGEGTRLETQFPELFILYVESCEESRDLLFSDFVLNRMDYVFSKKHTVDREEAIAIMNHMSSYAKVIRATVSGYEQSEDGQWSHPLKKKVFKLVHYRSDPAKLAQRAKKRKLENRRVGRPPKERPQALSGSSENANFEPP